MARGSGAAHRSRSHRPGHGRRRSLSTAGRRIAARLIQGAVAAFAAATFAFICIQIAPGDPVTALGEGVPPAVRDQLRAVYGYDDPVLVQYVRWLGALMHGNLGWSTSQQRLALDVVLDALPNTLLLVTPGLVLGIIAGSAMGAWQGLHAKSRGDRVISTLVFVLYGIPEFTLALLLLLLFSVTWPVLPSGGMVSDMHNYLPFVERIQDRVCHLALPTLVVALFDAAALARFQRLSMRDALAQPFVHASHAAGLPPSRVHRRAWRASLLPVLSMVGLLLPLNVLGVVFVEQIFSWPGLGLVLYTAITGRDYDVVAACVIVQGVVIALSGVLVELLRGVADPRLRAIDGTLLDTGSAAS